MTYLTGLLFRMSQNPTWQKIWRLLVIWKRETRRNIQNRIRVAELIVLAYIVMRVDGDDFHWYNPLFFMPMFYAVFIILFLDSKDDDR